jgi:hypothetical protein
MNRSNQLRQVLLPAVVLLFITCNKHIPQAITEKLDLVAAARTYIDSISTTGYPLNYRASQPKTIRWELAQVVPVGKSEGILVPIVFDNALLVRANFAGSQPFHLDYLTQLLFYKDSTGTNTARVITAFPDSNYFKDPTRPFTGLKFIEGWLGNPVEKLLYTTDGKIKRYVPNNKQIDLLAVIETCYTISGYNYSPELDETEYWTEPGGCSTEFIDDGSGDALGGAGSSGPGSGGGGGGSSAGVPIIPTPTSIVASVKNYFQCFTNVGGSDHTYTITVCVDEPDPGTREPWTFTDGGPSGTSGTGNPVNAGHTFLILSESYYGTTITRNIGFYPSTAINPVNPNSQGVFNDDDNHSYNISGSFTVNSAQFFSTLNYITSANTTGYLYNLNTNNCTTFAINAVYQAGITLPRTVGTWLGGAGDDPGDLGEDLRTKSVPGMTLNTAPAGAHPNVGQCD